MKKKNEDLYPSLKEKRITHDYVMSLHDKILEHEASIETLRRAIRIELIREWLAQRELTVWDNVLYITSEGQFRARITKISIENSTGHVVPVIRKINDKGRLEKGYFMVHPDSGDMIVPMKHIDEKHINAKK